MKGATANSVNERRQTAQREYPERTLHEGPACSAIDKNYSYYIISMVQRGDKNLPPFQWND